jgi:hypothetical protein
VQGSFESCKKEDERLKFIQEIKEEKYKFIIPKEYPQLNKKRKKISEFYKIDNTSIHFYDLNVIEIVTKKRDRHYMYQDGFNLVHYFNKDIKMVKSSY